MIYEDIQQTVASRQDQSMMYGSGPLAAVWNNERHTNL
jgi:hypothetical protein